MRILRKRVGIFGSYRLSVHVAGNPGSLTGETPTLSLSRQRRIWTVRKGKEDPASRSQQ